MNAIRKQAVHAQPQLPTSSSYLAKIQNHFREEPCEVFAICTLILVAALAAIEKPSTFFFTLENVSVFIFKSLCAATVVYLSTTVRNFLGRLDRTSVTHNEGGIVEYEKDTSPPTPPAADMIIPPTPQLPSAMRRPIVPSTPQTSFRVSPPQPHFHQPIHPSHHSGILGPSPYPQRFSNHNHANETSTPRPQKFFQEEVPAVHPRKSGYNGTPATAGFRHFNGMGFAENRERLSEVRMRREYSRDEEREGE